MHTKTHLNAYKLYVLSYPSCPMMTLAPGMGEGGVGGGSATLPLVPLLMGVESDP